MKKQVLIVLFSTVLFAQEYTTEHRIKDMQIMAKAMTQIETGFFYNNNDLVQMGALTLSDAIRRIEPPLEEKEEKDPMTRYMNEKVKFTNKIVKQIDQKAKTILERFKEGDVPQAVQAYTKIMKECMECHVQVRHW
jgi:hypothetical protein